jgi:hypothetical protein
VSLTRRRVHAQAAQRDYLRRNERQLDGPGESEAFEAAHWNLEAVQAARHLGS